MQSMASAAITKSMLMTASVPSASEGELLGESRDGFVTHAPRAFQLRLGARDLTQALAFGDPWSDPRLSTERKEKENTSATTQYCYSAKEE